MPIPPAGVMEIDPSQPIPTYPGKSCGSCTACCSVVPVSEIGLKPYHRCLHLWGLPDMRVGCSIYAARPRSCRMWSCIWLSSDLPEELRPDRCGVVFDPLPNLVSVNGKELAVGQAWALPGYEEAYQEQPVMGAIRALCATGVGVQWYVAFRPGEPQRCRVFVPLPGGDIGMSDLHEVTDKVGGHATERDRLIAAQQLMRKR